MTEARFDVAVVGGGLVGATLVCALAIEGLRVAVIEPREASAIAPDDPYDSRVSAINVATESILRALAVWPLMPPARLSPFRSMSVWESRGSGAIRFDCTELGEPRLGHIVENRVIQGALHERTRGLDSITWYCPDSLLGFEVSADHVVLSLASGEQVRAALLVGADGTRSKVRQLSGIGYAARDYAQQALVTHVRPARGHQHTAWQRFLPTGPLAFLPLPNHQCAIVWSHESQSAGHLAAMPEAHFRYALAQAFGQRLGAIESIGPRAVFPLSGGQAESYVRPRLALIGDAAHAIHPLAGQGANLGFLDAATLVDVLAGAHGGDLGDWHVLRRYERARKADNLLMQRAMEGFSLLFGNSLAPVAWLRSRGLALTDAAGPVKRQIMRYAMGIAGDCPTLARPVHDGLEVDI